MAAKQASIVNKRKEETKLNIPSTIKTQINNLCFNSTWDI